MTKLDFHRFQVRPFGDNFEQCYDYVRTGQRQRADLSVFILQFNVILESDWSVGGK